MRKIIVMLLIMVFFAAAPCFATDTPSQAAMDAAEGAPSQAAMDAATAVVAMHDSVMKERLGVEYSFAALTGAGDVYLLFQDDQERNLMMVGLDDTGERAAAAVIQAYDEDSFSLLSLNSLRAVYLPFCTDEERPAFESWLGDAAYGAIKAARAGENTELDYYYGEYAACGISEYLDGEKQLFTALVSWYAPLSADDINALME